MVSPKSTILAAAALLSGGFTYSYAEEPHDHDHHTPQTHVHGAWELFAALDGDQLSVTFKGPLVDVLGFERLPTNEEERTALRSLKVQLSEAQPLLALDERAGCRMSKPAEILLPEGYADAITSGEKSDAQNTGEQSHDHKVHQHNDHHGEHDTHASDVEVNYIFDCRSPAKLREITATAFETFPGIEGVDAVFLGDATQEALRLTRGSNTLRLD